LDEERLGNLYASEKDQGKLVVELIHVLLRKEFEKKKVGSEVLGLYKEINLIYDFSEQISEKIDIKSIGESALKEATQIIKASHGLAIIYYKEKDEVNEIASFGENPDKIENIESYTQLLKELVLRGTSEIFSSHSIENNPATNHLKSLMIAPLKVKDRQLGLLMIGHEEHKEFTAAELKLLTTIAVQSASAIDSALLYEKGLNEAKKREEEIRRINEVSLKFVPFEFLKSLNKSSLQEVNLGDQVEREVTVLFADIRDFTTISEKLEPNENFLFIHEFNQLMGPIIRKHQGFIMQYLGDGFMAIFPGGSQDAIDSSVSMNKALLNLNKKHKGQDLPLIRMGIGMQKGKLIMGITGDVERMEAVIISDTVNTASRIEGLSKHFGTNILITGECYHELTDADSLHFRYLGKVKVKGKQIPLDLYECIDGDEEKIFIHKLTTAKRFSNALELFLKKDFAMAAVSFQEIFKQNKQDIPARLFLNRSAQLITQQLDEDWQGVEMVGKM
jgi:class 3 adenylate cyclase